LGGDYFIVFLDVKGVVNVFGYGWVLMIYFDVYVDIGNIEFGFLWGYG